MGDYKHTSSLPKAVMDQIRPIFKDLSKTELLSKCLEGYTQNANESLNGLIRKLCPKVGNHGLVTVDISVGLAVSVFNCGASAFGQVLAQMGLCVGKFSLDFFFFFFLSQRTLHAYRTRQATDGSGELRKIE